MNEQIGSVELSKNNQKFHIVFRLFIDFTRPIYLSILEFESH